MSARSKARKRAVDVIFEAEQRAVDTAVMLSDRQVDSGTQTPLSPYSTELVEGVIAHQERIDEILETYSQGWALNRMPAVDRAILRIGVWEILYNDEVPDGVALSEAVMLATNLSTDDSPTFVNGLLGRVLELKPGLAE